MIYKYTAIGFLWLISLLGSSFLAYQKGSFNERNSIEVKQLKVQVQNQNQVIIQQQQTLDNTNKQIAQYTDQIQNIQESYTNSQREIHKYETLLNNSNRINALYLRSIHALSASSVHGLSNATGHFDAESAAATYVSTTRVAEYELGLRKQCENNRVQLNNLIDWVNNQEQIYGDINAN